MPSLFVSLAAAAGATVDAIFSEGFTLEPRVAPAVATGRPDPNARRVPITSRDSLAFIGTFVADGAQLHARGRAMDQSTTRVVIAEQPMIDVAVAALPQRPVQGDRVTRSDTGEVFEVTRFVPHDLGRAWIHLAAQHARAENPT